MRLCCELKFMRKWGGSIKVIYFDGFVYHNNNRWGVVITIQSVRRRQVKRCWGISIGRRREEP